jgi:hypothetical protein
MNQHNSLERHCARAGERSKSLSGLRMVGYLILVLLAGVAQLAQAATFPHYDLAVTFDLARSTLIGTAVIHNPANRQTSIALGNLAVKRITVAGRELPVPTGENIITVGTPGRIEIEYSMQYKEGEDSLVSPDAVLLRGDWYPAVKGMQVYHLTVTLPTGFTAVSEAESIREIKAGESLRFEFDFPHPLPAADGITLVASRQFAVRKSRYGAVEIATYLLPAHAGRAAVFLAGTKRYLRRFEALLGPYPFKRLAIVETPSGGSMAMPTYILLKPAEFEIDDMAETALGHEIAHQWFGNLAYIDYYHGNWAEGLAIYFADHADAQAAGKGCACRKRMIEGYENNVDESHAMPLNAFMEREDRPSKYIGYGKSAMIFHMLRVQVGDAAFFRSMRAFLRTNRFRVAGWDDLQRAFEGETRRHFGWFFAQWVQRDDVPDLRVEDVRVARKGANYDLDFVIRQNNKPFRLVLPVTYRFEGGVSTVRLNLATADQAYHVALPGRPQEIVLDPNYDVFRRPSLKEITPTIDRLLTRPKAVVVAPDRQGERFAALPDILAEAEVALNLQWRQGTGPLKRSANPGVSEHWREAFDQRRSGAGNPEMQSASLILLGKDNPAIGKLFGDLPLPDSEFSVTILTHPRNPAEVVAVVTTDSGTEWKADATMAMNDYRRYSTLRFRDGKVVFKHIEPSQRGIRVVIP